MKKNKNMLFADETLSTLNAANMTWVMSDPFAGTGQEIDELGDALINNEDIWVDNEGALHRQADVEGLDTLNTSNMTKVNQDPFAHQSCLEDPYREYRTEDTGHSPAAAEADPVSAGFSGQERHKSGLFDYDDSSLEMDLDEEGILHERDDSVEGQTHGHSDEGDRGVLGNNMYRVNKDPFAAHDAVPRKPSNPDQWYNKSQKLFVAEVANMRSHYPGAILGFFKSTGNMYWIIEQKIAKGLKPWTFLLEYEKDHPNNHGYGGSIHVQLLKSPSNEDLERMAKEYGRPGVPHRVSGTRADGEKYVFLCTRRPEDVKDGRIQITTAVQVAGWAADWALHFEAGLRRKDVWNKWCDDSHFRYLVLH